MKFTYLDGFSTSLKAFSLLKLFAYAQSGFAGFLINIYFWRITHDIHVLVLYNVVSAVAHACVYVLSGKIAKETSRFIPLRIGAVAQIIYLGLILMLGEGVAAYVIPVAIMSGVADGFYWSSDNLLKFDLTNPDNRLRFGALQSISSSFAKGIIPLLASILVVAGAHGIGAYGRIFTAAILCAGLVFTSSFFISKERRLGTSRFRFWRTARRLCADRNIRLALAGTLLSQVTSVLTILIGLLLFLRTGTEISLGAYQFVTVAVTVITSYVLGKSFTRKNYSALIIWGGFGDFVAVGVLLLSQSYLAIVLYGVLTSFFSFSDTPRYPLVLDALTGFCKDQTERDTVRVEYIAMLDTVDAVGKVIGYLGLLFVGNLTNTAIISAVVVFCALAGFASSLVLAQIRPEIRN